MRIGQRFSFDSAGFHAEVAHDGHGTILTSRVFRGDDASHCRFVDLSTVPAGSAIGTHTHERDNHELYVIVAGRGLMELDGEVFEVGPGDAVLTRPGSSHGLKQVGKEDLVILINYEQVPK